jgi:hypothetical protein
MPYVIGIVLGLVTALIGRTVGFDRDRAFYPTILIVVGAYYALFAAMGAPQAVIAETVGGVVFLALAIIGFRTNLWLVAAGLAGHGVFDSFHGRLVNNQGVPTWWPAFCMTIDVVLGVALAWLLRSGRLAPSVVIRQG